MLLILLILLCLVLASAVTSLEHRSGAAGEVTAVESEPETIRD